MRHSRLPRALTLVTLAALGSAAAPLHAQDCVFPSFAAGAPDEIPPVSSGVFVASPPQGTDAAPLNVELRFGGATAELDANPPNFRVELLDDNGLRVPITRSGSTARPADLLRPLTTYTARVAPTETNPCVGCFVVHEISFTTGVDEDHEAPTLVAAPDTFVFALPSQAELQRCGICIQETHIIAVDFGPVLPLNTWVSIAAKHERQDPQFATERFYAGGSSSISTSGGQQPVALGDAFLVAFTARDLAGNVSPARVVRTRARSFRDGSLPREQLSDLTCDVPGGLRVGVASPLPQNGLVQVDFPFEEQPVSLRGEDGELVALFPVQETRSGHIYAPATPLTADATYDVVTRDCAHCVCTGCALEDAVSVAVGRGEDTAPPRAPVLQELLEDVDPVRARDQCVDDRPALVVVLAPGVDDQASPVELRYRATVKIKDGLTYELGSGHRAVDRGDGSVALRLETPGLPRLLGERLTLTLDVEDAAGNTARGVFVYDPDTDDAGGCAASTPGSLLACAALLVGVRRRRRA